jgi:uncharacterized protein (DUF1330 family)
MIWLPARSAAHRKFGVARLNGLENDPKTLGNLANVGWMHPVPHALVTWTEGTMISRTAKLALTLIGGAAAVAAFVRSRRVLSEKRLAYLVAEVEVTDPVAFQVYLNKAMQTLKPYNVRVISNSKPVVKEGTPAQGHVIILGFNSLTDAQKWYGSSPYKELIPERQKAANTRVYFVEGMP